MASLLLPKIKKKKKNWLGLYFQSLTLTAAFFELIGGFLRAMWKAAIMSPVHYSWLRNNLESLYWNQSQ